MAKVKVSVVHDEFGQIVSVSRPERNAKVTVLAGERQSVLITDVEEDSIEGLIGTQRVDTDRKSLTAAA